MYGGWTRCHHPEHSSAGPPMSTPKDLLIFQEDFLKFRQNDIQLHDITRFLPGRLPIITPHNSQLAILSLVWRQQLIIRVTQSMMGKYTLLCGKEVD